MAEDIIINVKNVWKRYGLPPILPWKKRRFHESDFALKDITFQVRRGGSLGILGRNGAGKSTLLKLLAGVTPPDKGSIDIRGSIFPMIELNTGISMELTGRENIALLATIMGFNDREIRRLEPEVIDFSELEDWIDRPVWQYSSGMLARLGFSIAVHTHTEYIQSALSTICSFTLFIQANLTYSPYALLHTKTPKH
ncbi:ABC transporter ATP-binding protein [Desulfovibrio piger]|uniref:ABC transporter ATP-binding protein n=1 Tax=Desulfovibrio piger TaxID=901 RepID=UPI003AB656DE